MIFETEQLSSQLYKILVCKSTESDMQNILLTQVLKVISLGEQEDLKPTAMDNCIEVFVSAVATPGDQALILVSRGQRNKWFLGRFWVQKIGPHSVDLDKLTQVGILIQSMVSECWHF